MHKLFAVTLKEILTKKIDMVGWLYLPSESWDLQSEGIMIAEDVDADPESPYPPKILERCNLIEVLDAAGIEDVIINAEEQLGNPSLEQLLLAFQFYYDNDAFIEFGE